MKRTIYLFTLLPALLLAGACERPEAPQREAEFTFAVTAVPTKGYVTGTDLVDDSGAERTIRLSAWIRGNNGRQENYFTDETFARDGAAWRHDPPIYAPVASTYDILGFSSQVPVPADDVLWGWPNNSDRMRLTFGEDHLQDDILYGAANSTLSTSSSVAMQMHHAQAWVEVRLRRKAGATGADAVVDSVWLATVYHGCDLTVEANHGRPEATCSIIRFVATDCLLGDPDAICGHPVTEAGGSLRILLPQQAMTSLFVAYTIGGKQTVHRSELPHGHWVMGVHYIYDYVFDPISEVFALASATTEPWTTGSSYNERI